VFHRFTIRPPPEKEKQSKLGSFEGLSFDTPREVIVNFSSHCFTDPSRQRQYAHQMKAFPLIIFVSLSLMGCASTTDSQQAYPAAYKEALNDFPGSPDVSPETISTFTVFLSELGSQQTGSRASRLYASDLHFSDALMLTRDRARVVKHFQGLVDAGTAVQVDILQTLVSGADVYLIWAMRAEFTPVRKPVISETIGITHLRFDDAGRVVLHQDFWDTGLGFYQHIPVLGQVVKSINRRFSMEDSGK
jgi:hypothetical protein